jgi:hypothetical protein
MESDTFVEVDKHVLGISMDSLQLINLNNITSKSIRYGRTNENFIFPKVPVLFHFQNFLMTTHFS